MRLTSRSGSRAVRLLDAALPVLSDTDHFIQNTVSVTEDTKQRISAVLVYFGRIRPTDRLDDPKSFAVRYLAADPDAAGVNQYGSPQIKKIYSRWFQTASLGRVQDLADALLQTYRDPPRMLEFKLDAATDLRTGSIFRADTRFIQDVDGSHALMPFEVIESKEERAGHLLAFKCQEMPKTFRCRIPTRSSSTPIRRMLTCTRCLFPSLGHPAQR